MTATVPPSHREAQFALCDRVPDDWPWAVTASANLALRGVDVAGLFSDAVVRPLRPPASEPGDRIPAMGLDYEARGYRARGEPDRAARIEHRL